MWIITIIGLCLLQAVLHATFKTLIEIILYKK